MDGPPVRPGRDDAQCLLAIANISKTLNRRRVLTGVHLTCGPAEICVVLGPNGAGKSTLLRIVCGLMEADHGTVEICGNSLTDAEVSAKACLGYVPDATDALPDLLASEFVAFVSAMKARPGGKRPKPDDSLLERLDVLPFWRHRIGALSFGQKKRVCLAAALCGNPTLLVMDEPTSGLDPSGIALIKSLITERQHANQCTLLSTNDLQFAQSIGGKQYRLIDGKLIRIPGAG